MVELVPHVYAGILATFASLRGGDRSSYNGNSYNIQNFANRKKLHQEIATFY